MSRHRRPQWRFRASGVFLLALGTFAGTYLGLGRLDSQPERPSTLAVPESTQLAQVDPAANIAEEKASIIARAKAAAAAAEEAERARRAEEVAKRNQEAASRSQSRTSYPVPASCNDYDGNRALGCALLLDAGFELDQMPCLDRLWSKESGWNERARNSSSGAYGIPQALPGSKMGAYGDDWETNPVPQIKWGLNYIEKRYGDPCGAWSFSQANNWY